MVCLMEMMASSIATAQEELEVFIAKERKRAKRIAAGWAVMGAFSIVMVWGMLNKPIPSLNEMRVSEGVLVEVLTERGRVNAKIVLREDDDSLSSVVPYGGSKPYEKRIGERFKVWSEEQCVFLNYFCYQNMMQLQYKGKIVIDYEKLFRPKKEEFKNGNFKYVFYGLPAFFFLLAIGTLQGIGRNINKIRNERGNSKGV